MEIKSALDLVVLGAGPAWSDRPGSSGAAYLVRSARAVILLDLGQGSFPRLIAEIEPSRLDAVVISHLHPDHFIDLVPLRHYLAYQLAEAGSVRVIGPSGLAGRIDALHDRAGFTAATLACEPMPSEPIVVGDLVIEARRVTHTPDSHAIRVGPSPSPGPNPSPDAGAGPGLVYSGDCGVASDLAPLIRPGDALLVEVSFGAAPVPPGSQHLNAAAIAELVAATRPGRVLLTHLQMGIDPAPAIAIVAAASDAPVELVEPGDRIDLRART